MRSFIAPAGGYLVAVGIAVCLVYAVALVFLPSPSDRTVPLPLEPVPAVAGIDAEALAAVAESWIGVPHRIGGRDRDGIDCSGLALELLTPLGATLPRRAEDMRAAGTRVGGAHIEAGDLVFFRTDRGDGLQGHVGVALGPLQFVHATASRGVIFSDLASTWWGPRLLEVRRVIP